MDFSFNHSGCAPPCPVTSYNIYLVQREGIPCVLAEKAGAPGEEAVLAGVKLEEGASIMITVLAYCQEDPCVRCTALKEVTIQDGRTVSLEMMTMPWCYKSPLPRQCR